MDSAIYKKLAALGQTLEALDREQSKIDEARAGVELQMKELARQIADVTATVKQSKGIMVDAHVVLADGLSPRYMKLLELLRGHAGGVHVSTIARAVYGSGGKKESRNVSSDFSRLRASRHIEKVKRGTFMLTEKGVRALNGGHH